MRNKLLTTVCCVSVMQIPLTIGSAANAEWESSANVGVFSEYRFRGIKQTEDAPAIQGGFDLSHSSGFYLGNWNSNVEFGNTTIEMDFYGGYAFDVGELSIDVGDLYYYYPDNSGNTPNINTNELYAIGSYGPVSVGYHYITTEAFGVGDDGGSTYTQINLDLPLSDKVGVTFHYGASKFEGAGALDYDDYGVSIAYDLGNGYGIGLDYVDTDASTASWGNTGKSGTVISFSKSM